MMETDNDYDGWNPGKTIAAAAAILAPIFHANGWTWALASAGAIPTEAEIVDTITELYREVLTSDTIRSSTGRIVVERDLGGEHGTPVEKEIFLHLGTVYGPECHPKPIEQSE